MCAKNMQLNRLENRRLTDVLALATGGDDESINLVIEAIGNDDDATKAFVNFMDGVTVCDNPTLSQVHFNHQLTKKLFKHISEYIVRD